jgi:hypothetical protein
MTIRSIILLFFAWFATAACGQTPQENYLSSELKRRNFDPEKWQELKEGIDYSKEKTPEEKAPEEKATPQDVFLIIKYLAIAITLGLLVWLLLRLATGDALFRPKNSKIKPEASTIRLAAIEENLLESDLDDPLRQAVQSGDYSMAVRLHYLSLLKELSLRKHIRWKKNKTNGEYLRELQGTVLFHPVQEATLVFERVWYGKISLRASEYGLIETSFRKTLDTVK